MHKTHLALILIFCLSSIGTPKLLLGQVQVKFHQTEPAYLYELNQWARSLCESNPDSTLKIVQEILAAEDSTDIPLNVAEAWLSDGLAKNSKGDWAEAEKSFRKALPGFRYLGDSLAVAYNLDYLGYAMLGQGFVDQHFAYQLQALNYRENFGGDAASLARSYSIIGSIYYEQGDLDKAQELYLKTLDIRKTIKGLSATYFGFTLRNLGKVEMKKKNFDEAIKYYHTAIDSFQVNKNNGWTREVYKLLGELYLDKGDLKQAEANFRLALRMTIERNNISHRAGIYYDLAKLYNCQNKPIQTLTLLDSAIHYFQQSRSNAYLKDCYELKAVTLEVLGKPKEALATFRQYNAVKDTLAHANAQQQIEALKSQYELRQQSQRIELLERKREQEQIIRLVLFLGFGLAVSAAAIVFLSNARRKKAYKALKVEKEKTDKLNANLKNTQQQLIQSEKMASLGQLTSGIAHEINNPLNFISSNLEALKLDAYEILDLVDKIRALDIQEVSHPEVNQLIQFAKSEDITLATQEARELILGIGYGSDRINEIVKGLQIFSHQSDDFSTVENLNETLQSAITILNNKIKKKEIQLHLQLGDLPAINCQPGKLSQVFINIIDNATHAIEVGGNLLISSSRNGEDIFIEFLDDGHGMDEATIKQMFDPFFTTKEVGEGTGLGMAISYSIIRDHGGKIAVDSQLGKGTRILISLPINR